ncbi:hypothetical protein AYO21_10162 [Fonsecaea monophora]|uniref:Uncharacterized protein n=1 Tax=Fonsecaea monophora TaxID=254056 RepID=A0A177EWB7_9EURO|nr:hypothetical protein AYO21_10162 [Fonsecaea monophora]OAG35691.1 hypothetical protein AYO21_10162 [Fonsecaea monophora]
MLVKSKSAIPLFIFLAIVLLFLPCAAILLICLRQRRRRLSDQKSRNEAIESVAKSMPNWTPSIELGNVAALPPVASIRPIRSLQTKKNARFPRLHSGGSSVDNASENHPTEIAAPKPTRAGKRYSVQVQNMEHLAAEQSPNPFENAPTSQTSSHATRYDLQAALVMEQSSAGVGRAGERSASINDAPRVKSQIVRPEHTAAAREGSPFPPTPSAPAACYAWGQTPRGWV